MRNDADKSEAGHAQKSHAERLGLQSEMGG